MALAEEAVKIFKALSDPTRYEMIRLLYSEGGEISCTNCAERFRLSAPALSHHYRILQNAGLITARKEGTFVFYKLNKTYLEKFVPRFSQVHVTSQN
jgi:DNA-binding transcriptional ArsR family regulator